MGCDLNRSWTSASPWSQPVLYTLKKLIHDMDNDKVSGLLARQWPLPISGTWSVRDDQSFFEALESCTSCPLPLSLQKSVLDMFVDIHAHSSLLGCFIYGNMYDDVYRLERHLLFPKLFSQVSEDFSAANTIYNRDPLKAGTARR